MCMTLSGSVSECVWITAPLCVCLLARLHGILAGMLKHADISRYGKESLYLIPTIPWNRHDVRVVVPALAEGQRSTVDEVYCICGSMEVGSENSIGDEIVSEGGREREVERQ